MRGVEQDRFNGCEPCMYDPCQTVQEILELRWRSCLLEHSFYHSEDGVKAHHQGENVRT